jgi:hypothetical protein
MMIVLLAEHALMNVRLKQYQRAISIRSILIYAPIVVHVQTFALLRQFIPHSIAIKKTLKKGFRQVSLFCYKTPESMSDCAKLAGPKWGKFTILEFIIQRNFNER